MRDHIKVLHGIQNPLTRGNSVNFIVFIMHIDTRKPKTTVVIVVVGCLALNVFILASRYLKRLKGQKERDDIGIENYIISSLPP